MGFDHFRKGWRLTTMACLCGLGGVGLAAVDGVQNEPSQKLDLLGLEEIDDILPIYDGNILVRNPLPEDELPPMRITLSKARYWAQDGHMDVVVRIFNPPEDIEVPSTQMRVAVRDAEGVELAHAWIDPVPSKQFVFYPRFPEELNGSYEFELGWMLGDNVLVVESIPFRVEQYMEPKPQAGRIPLTILNEEMATADQVPFTVGVPFPRGVLPRIESLRLRDETGRLLPVQITETARWSKFGPVKWVLCDFALDVDGGRREVFLEYGEESVDDSLERATTFYSGTGQWESAMNGSANGFPRLDVGRVRVDEGLWFDVSGEGGYVPILTETGLNGAFVEHEDGRVYRASVEDRFEVEEAGPIKFVLKREGWYHAENNEFCLYLTRYVIFRDSPIWRVFHTWVYTGDANRDRVANMGWQFELAEGLEPDGFLSGFQAGAEWLEGDFLLQYEYNEFELANGSERAVFEEGRAPGVAAVMGDQARVYFGVRDFWPNYPSELEFVDGAFWFYNWPRHNKPNRWSLDPTILTEEEWRYSLTRVLYAHQGEVLDFRMPPEIAEDPIWTRADDARPGGNPFVEEGDSETVNAQGISRTEEMWIYVTAPEIPKESATAVLKGLNQETLRAIVDPRWLAESGVIHGIYQQDEEKYPEEEAAFALLARAPGQWAERLETYGMWIYGDHPGWSLGLENRAPHPYRAFRKSHHGWPYSWVPFARSGDPDLLRLADAATRQWIDVAHCHYVGEDVQRRVAPTRFTRELGYWNTGPVPWAGGAAPSTRSMHQKAAPMLHSWYLTGYPRAKDHFHWWAKLTKEEREAGGGPIRVGYGRGVAILKSYVDAYGETFDPWFLVASHEMADGLLTRHAAGQWYGRTVSPSERDFHLFTGRDEFIPYYMDHADVWGTHLMGGRWTLGLGVPRVDTNAYAWRLSGDDYYLGRVEGDLESLKANVYDGGEPEFYRGYLAQPGHQSMATGYWLDHFPLALGVIDDAGRRVEPIGKVFQIGRENMETEGPPTIAVLKPGGEPLTFHLAAQEQRGQKDGDAATYSVTGPDGETFLTGVWDLGRRTGGEVTPRRPGHDVVIPAEAPAGVYRLRVEFENPDIVALDIPVTEPGSPEVLELTPEQRVPGSGEADARYWFMVPDGVERFYLKVRTPSVPVARGWIRNADGEVVWKLNYHDATYEGPDPVHVEIEVPPDQAGRLWQIFLLRRGAGFYIDPQIPPYYSTEASRWFSPEDEIQ